MLGEPQVQTVHVCVALMGVALRCDVLGCVGPMCVALMRVARVCVILVCGIQLGTTQSDSH